MVVPAGHFEIRAKSEPGRSEHGCDMSRSSHKVFRSRAVGWPQDKSTCYFVWDDLDEDARLKSGKVGALRHSDAFVAPGGCGSERCRV